MKLHCVFGVGLTLLSACASADTARLDLPNFSHLERKAVEAVDFTFGRSLLGPASWFIGSDEEGRQLKALLSGIKSVSIRNYEFKEDYVYSKADIDSVRRQLDGSGWSRVLQSHDRHSGEDVDMYLALDGDQAVGFALVASDPREFTIIHVIGNVDLEAARKLGDQFRPRKQRTSTSSLGERVIVAAQH